MFVIKGKFEQDYKVFSFNKTVTLSNEKTKETLIKLSKYHEI